VLLYIGIDEAGYGPMLGPLCVGVAAVRVQNWQPQEQAPNVWSLLRRAVCKAPGDKKGRLAVADSKKLCKPMAQGHGRLAEAERSVLGFVHALTGAMPGCDGELFEALGVAACEPGWYSGEPMACPAHANAAEVKIAANMLARAMAATGISCELLGVSRTDEARFNAMIAGGRSKANTTLAAIAEHAPHILTLIENTRDEFGEVHTRIVLDRQGGRTRYEAALSHVFGRPLRTLAEAAEASTYEFADLPNARIRVQARAEDGHFPVALASMQAKLVRELSMERFNAYWGGRREGVKPTAGYTTDARRWLADMEGAISADERRALVRLA
jgi:ribonuclease HII